MGQKAHIPTDDIRGVVSQMAAVGVPQPSIAKVVGLSDRTLRKYYREELDEAAIKANANVANTLYKKAMSGDTTSLIFWLKTRAGWKETSVTEKVGPNGGPQEIKHTVTFED